MTCATAAGAREKINDCAGVEVYVTLVSQDTLSPTIQASWPRVTKSTFGAVSSCQMSRRIWPDTVSRADNRTGPDLHAAVLPATCTVRESASSRWCTVTAGFLMETS